MFDIVSDLEGILGMPMSVRRYIPTYWVTYGFCSTLRGYLLADIFRASILTAVDIGKLLQDATTGLSAEEA